MGVTSRTRATAAGDSPRANRRAASNRRASSLPTSRFLAMPQHGIVAHHAHNFIPRASLVGREEEAELLLRRWLKAKGGEGQVVLLSGEAGIGKSRLTATM